jgi:Cof subfamily protein (haloacid dehalogenase superfamily)
MKQKSESRMIFFDVDGTLLCSNGEISQSVQQAILTVQKNGHKICLATGRSKSNLTDEILAIPWDGYILGSGIYGEYQKKVVMHEQIPAEHIREFVEYTKPLTKLALLLENNTATYATAAGIKVIKMIFQKISEANGIDTDKLLGRFKIVEDLASVLAVNKMLYFHGGDYIKEMMTKFQDKFDFLPYSVAQSDGLNDGEIMKKNITKAWGIEKIAGYAGYPRERIIAFGDGYNDIEMVAYAGIGIAMGNGAAAVKEKADLITESHDEDGIPKALIKLELI